MCACVHIYIYIYIYIYINTHIHIQGSLNKGNFLKSKIHIVSSDFSSINLFGFWFIAKKIILIQGKIFEMTQNGSESKRVLSSQFCWLRSANNVNFSDKWVICMHSLCFICIHIEANASCHWLCSWDLACAGVIFTSARPSVSVSVRYGLLLVFLE